MTKVVVVEKDTVFQRLITMPEVEAHIMCVTAKGYPDFNTRRFLLNLQSEGKELVYVGDADPCGAEIYFQYVFGSRQYAIVH